MVQEAQSTSSTTDIAGTTKTSTQLPSAQLHTVDVFLLPGVTDTLAESVIAGAHMLGITGLEQVATGRRYLLDSRLSEADVEAIAEALLYNPVIQHYTLHTHHGRTTNDRAY